MSSSQIYYTYYSPTDIQHPNKVQYTDNLSAAGDILVTSIKGFNNLNKREILTSSWGDGIQKQNDFNYNVSITNGFKYGYEFNNSLQYVGTNSNMNNTVARQLTIDDFDYDTIFGLTRVDPSVIDYNYYKGVTNNVFNEGIAVTNKETTRIGPKLFVYKSNINDYLSGNIDDNGGQLDKKIAVNNPVVETNVSTGTYNNISKYSGQQLTWNNKTVVISNTETLYNLENAWPYKIQYNANQWYQMLTNGQKSALLTLPYWHTDAEEASDVTNRYYILNVEKGTDGNPRYSYYKIDKIVENNYYYIVSYFDTRPTIKNNPNILFDSNHSSLFNENLVQILPLAKYDYRTFLGVHKEDTVSNIAACVPVCYTVSKESNQPIVPADPTTNTPRNFGFNPIPIKYEKNITITTTLNYTIANMTNLSNILTGWNYLHKNFDSTASVISRGNLPYINVGILVYIPSTHPDYAPTTNIQTGAHYKNKFVRFHKWLDSFNANNGSNAYYFGYNTETYERITMNNIYDIYKDIYNNPNGSSERNLPACINFSNTGSKYTDYLSKDNKFDPNTWFYENTEVKSSGSDLIKFINTLSVPINNALNTTHTATDNYTFRLTKIQYDNPKYNNTEYFYIIGTYIYITKNLDTATSAANPHYLGFSPSTNITLDTLLSSGSAYLYPNRIIDGLMVDSHDPTIKYNDITGKDKTNTYALMKDIFVTPSLYMTLNESVGDV